MLGITALDRYGDPSMVDEAKFLSDFAQHAAAQMSSVVPGPPDPRTVAVKAIDLAILAQPDKGVLTEFVI